MSEQFWSVLPGNLSPLTMIFPVCDPDEMRLTDSDPIIGSWPGEGGSGCCVRDGIIPAYLF